MQSLGLCDDKSSWISATNLLGFERCVSVVCELLEPLGQSLGYFVTFERFLVCILL